MQKVLFTVSLIALTQFSCKKDDKDKKTDLTSGTLAGKTYYLVDANALETTDSQVKGSGSLVFASPLGSITSKDDYVLDFSLEDGGSLELVTHSSSTLSNGISVLLSRAGHALTATLKAKGATTSATELSGVDAATSMAIAVDVHNDETPAHILVWSANGGSFGEGDALLNSEDGEAAPGNGTGTAWGLLLTKATVSSAVADEPKFVE